MTVKKKKGCKVLNKVCSKKHYLSMESIRKGILSVKNGT